ncbi:hypothetical protein ILUMI_21875 [Ignelater luminosus]|uniref:Saccharopine dehydrogenase NADP binding domain-containing protein n=1 Tax=Ignelater luminosus TaxID=2038154 RepID=A0A8K0CGV3_IGNLU|nr:hypothetical protein ILUMI_21875 [Ignelater luminosus]
MGERLDIIVFGATGVTGKYTLPYVYKFAKSAKGPMTWGIAGRSKQKLKDVLNETAKRIGVNDLNHIPIIIADVEDEDSIRRMTAQAKVVINCCGPYQLYGEVVVKACVENGTHHVDVSGESQFIEGMQLKYHKEAEEKGVYIVSACGFDSVPSDLGTLFVEKHFEGTMNSVEVYLHCSQEGGFTPGPKTNYGTWASAVNAVGNYWSLFSLRKKLYPKSLPAIQPKLSLKYPIHKMGNKWALPFPATDFDVVKRSQRYFYENDEKRPIQVQCYVLMDSFITAMSCIFLGFFFLLLTQFKFGRYLLLTYPEFFSLGFFSRKDIPEDVLQRLHFSFTLHGKGWKEIITENKCKIPINKTVVGRVSAVNPGYGFTCLALTLCAIMILKEPKQLPVRGGVYTPAVAFSKTSFVEELQRNGVTFEIISNKED